jgi:hypothetical protein
MSIGIATKAIAGDQDEYFNDETNNFYKIKCL